MTDERDAYDEWHAQLPPDAQADAPWHRLAWPYMNPARDIGDRTILEIACGRGGFSVALAATEPRPARVVGADFSAVALEKAAELAATKSLANISWQQEDILAISFSTDTFDTVFSFETIEHVDDPARAVRELARVLRPGGRLFLTTPNYLGPLGLYRGYLWLRGRHFSEAGQPINKLTMIPRTLAWLKQAGLRVILVRGTGHYFPFPGRPAIRWSLLDRLPWLQVFGLHSMFLAEKRGSSDKGK